MKPMFGADALFSSTCIFLLLKQYKYFSLDIDNEKDNL